ncbi:MAG: hypothetical protein BGO98_38025 [Myxococcales bacterium 68-20]|nr:MAG: hypothetical protein BGO98_38025 [Myxococcales bacterium 68-20]
MLVVVGTTACAETMTTGVEDRLPADGDAGVTAPFVAPPEAGSDSSASEASTAALLCIGTDCSFPYATCATDGQVGYKCGTNLLTDDQNCGECGNACPGDVFGERRMITKCVQGECQLVCQGILNFGDQTEDPRDCNGLIDDGCETDVLSDPDNCGACGTKCGSLPDGTREPCIERKCGCPAGTTYCPGAGCVDIKTSTTNCGACGTVCEPSDSPPDGSKHLELACRAGTCTYACRPSWDDCDKDASNGCEPRLLGSPNCGACGVTCAANQECSTFQFPAACICGGPNEAVCGGQCTDLLSDPQNCGGCFHRCPSDGANSRASCIKGYCTSECEVGFGDCDGNPLNGCETDLRHDSANCGACGVECDRAAGQPCVEGRCLMVECDAGIVTK